MITVREAASRLGISPSLVYSLVARGRIRHERFGLGRGVIRIAEEALAEYRKSSEVQLQTPPRRSSSSLRLRHLRLD